MERRLSTNELQEIGVPNSTGLLHEKQSLDEQAARLGEHFRSGMSSTEEIPSGELAHLGSDFQVVFVTSVDSVGHNLPPLTPGKHHCKSSFHVMELQ